MSDIQQKKQLIKQPEVTLLCGLSRSTIYKLCSTGLFPCPVKVPGIRSVRWVRGEVQTYIDQRTIAPRALAPLCEKAGELSE